MTSSDNGKRTNNDDDDYEIIEIRNLYKYTIMETTESNFTQKTCNSREMI